MIKEYIVKKKKKGNPIGILIADRREDGAIKCGFSLCCKTDTFNDSLGESLAIDKMNDYSDLNLPHSIAHQYARFCSHAERYFKYMDAKNK